MTDKDAVGKNLIIMCRFSLKYTAVLVVSKRLGHASVITAGGVYGHLLPGWQRQAANLFAKPMEEV